MKIYSLSEGYQLVDIENGGEKLKISFDREGLQEQDFVFLSNHPDLSMTKYEIIKVREYEGLLYADLVRIPEKDQ